MLIFAGNVYNKHRNMLLTTTPAIEDHTIREYKGVVFGEVITGVNFLKDFAASIRNFLFFIWYGWFSDANCRFTDVRETKKKKTVVPRHLLPFQVVIYMSRFKTV